MTLFFSQSGTGHRQVRKRHRLKLSDGRLGRGRDLACLQALYNGIIQVNWDKLYTNVLQIHTGTRTNRSNDDILHSGDTIGVETKKKHRFSRVLID